MNTVKTLSLSAVLLAGGALFPAHAGIIVSDIATGTAEFNIKSLGDATINLTAKNGLTAGSYAAGAVIATGWAKASAGEVAYRWSPNTGKAGNVSSLVNGVLIIPGTNSKNTITVALKGEGVSGKDGGEGWIVTGVKDVKLSVENYAQALIKPDTYKLSVDAVVWSS